MLFQITLSAKLAALHSSPVVQLNPQLEAADEAAARENLSRWLEATGYVLADGAEVKIVAVDADTGLPPELKQVNDLADQLAEAKAKIAELSSSDILAERDALKGQVQAMQKAVADSNATLDKVSAERDDLKLQLDAASQSIASKDSELATLKSQLEEALAAKAKLAASPAPTDGSTPAT